MNNNKDDKEFKNKVQYSISICAYVKYFENNSETLLK